MTEKLSHAIGARPLLGSDPLARRGRTRHRQDMRPRRFLVLALSIAWVSPALHAQASPSARADTGATEPLAAAWARALSYDAFRAADTTRAAKWAAADARADASVADVMRTAAVPAGRWHLLVVADHACTDSPEAVPYLAELSRRVPRIAVRVLRRADGLGLLQTHLLNGHTATPLVLVLDSALREVGVWHERAAHIQQYVTDHEGRMPFDTLAAHVVAMRRADAGRTPVREVLALLQRAARP